MPDLTDQARANLDAGATDGPGTSVCRRCGGPKEPTRVNSAACRACGKNVAPKRERPTGVPTRTLRTDLPADVWQRFADEAAAKGSNPGRFLRDLIVARDQKKYGATPSTAHPPERR